MNITPVYAIPNTGISNLDKPFLASYRATTKVQNKEVSAYGKTRGNAIINCLSKVRHLEKGFVSLPVVSRA